MNPGWRVFAGAAAAVAVWTLGLCAWTLVTRGGPTLDLGPTIALETPTEPETVSPAPLPTADTSASGPADPTDPADVPDAPAVPAPTATDPAPPVEPQPAPTSRTAGTRTAAATPAAPAAAAPAESVAHESVPADPAPAAAPTAPHAPAPTRPDGWQQPARPAAEEPWEPVRTLEPEQHGGSAPGWYEDGRPDEPRTGCDDDRRRWDRTPDGPRTDEGPAMEQPPKDRRDARHGSATGHRR